MRRTLTSGINTNIELKTGNWLLVVGGRAIVPTMLKMTARLAENGTSAALAAETADDGLKPSRPVVHVVDGGHRYDPSQVERLSHGRREILERIKVSEAFDCHEMLSILEGLPAGPEPFVVIDLLRPFHDPFVWAGERKRLLRLCLVHLNRLVGASARGGLVSVHPPCVLSQIESELLEMVTTNAKDTFQVPMMAPASSMARRI